MRKWKIKDSRNLLLPNLTHYYTDGAYLRFCSDT